jgi:hypothetical protein
MAQVTQTKLQELSVLKLYEHYGALERSLPLLTPESQELAKAELEACANLRSEKVDRIYYAMAAHEDALERIKKESDLIQKAKQHHQSQLNQLKGLINWLRRSAPLADNRITGRNYQFVLVKKKDLTVEISVDPEHWHTDDRKKFCIYQEVTTTKRIVVRSMDGEVLEERIEPKQTTELLPNLDAIRTAHQTGQQIPEGVKVFQEYSVRSKRIFSSQTKPDLELELEMDASEHCGVLLSEAGSPD